MKETELWNYFWERKMLDIKPLDRYFIWVKPADFEAVKNLFKKEYNFSHPTNSYRSRAYFKHIHAVDEGELVCIHQDFGNWTKFPPLIILHLLADVLPYIPYCLAKGIKTKDLSRPNWWSNNN